MIRDWLKSRASLLAELQEERLQRQRYFRDAVDARLQGAWWQEIAAEQCPDHVRHMELRVRLHRAEVALQEARGEDPHTASRRTS